MVYLKLVRDRTPERIEESGGSCTVDVLGGEDYLKAVDAKLAEELSEYYANPTLEELADLLEVIRAAAVARGYSPAELEEARAKKAAEQGVFERKLQLIEVFKAKQDF